ncbi:MAG: J domain-containing protein [Oscillatoria sp. SIO1A7]|nr:J domain-containing protein [Oscillatoria sp. SIO1A7]
MDSAPQGTSELALSSSHARLEQLEEEHQWLLKQIKRKRTELTNFLEQMRSIALEIVGRTQPIHQRLLEIDVEIHALFEEIFTTRKLGKQSRKKIEEVYRMLQKIGAISPKYDEDDEDLEEDWNEDGFGTEREDDSDFNFNFNSDGFDREDNAPPDRENSNDSPDLKQMRRSFLRLASIFHPDKVTNQDKKEDYEEIMKEVNRAYEEGDMARLLELERQYELDKSINLENASSTEVERQCDRLEMDNQMLKTQYDNIKSELRWMRRTPEGEMVKEYRSLVREGFDPIQEMVSAAEHQIQEMEKIRNFVANFRDKKITIKEFLKGPDIGRKPTEEELEEMMEQLFSELMTIHMDDF